MVYPVDFSNRIYCLITGASRGIGRQIAVDLARKSSKMLTLVLLARSETGLCETKALVAEVNKNVNVVTQSVDLSIATNEIFEQILQDTYNKSDFDTAIIFHNAGHIGYIHKAVELTDREEWKKYYDLNVISVTVLNSVFLKTVLNNAEQVFVINITSLLGRKAFKYLSMYGSGKAARDLYFKILAEEEPNVVVLNYSPGMVQTSMANELITNIQPFEDSEIAASVRDNPSFLTPEQTIDKMFSLLEKAEFTSGDIVDFYD